MNTRLIISSPNRSSGKTTITIGLAKALRSQKLTVQTFKKGPDYIDPLWLSFASGGNRPCYNLDHFMMGKANIISSFTKMSKDADISLIEGNMGLYDSIDIEGKGSTAELARILKTPIVLVINARGINRGIAPLVLGYQNFEKDITIAGIILNKVRGKRHEDKLKNALRNYCNIAVLGTIPIDEQIEINERYLGLTPFVEEERNYEILDYLGKIITENVNLEKIIKLGATKIPIPKPNDLTLIKKTTKKATHLKTTVRIAQAKDKAFHFYYPDNIEALNNIGASIIPFDTINDKTLPCNINAIYIGGGFPELFMDEIAENIELKEQIKKAINRGIPVYAECGGLMYLAKEISFRGKTKKMIGTLPLSITQENKPQGFGYTLLESNNKGFFRPCGVIKAHEFHYSKAKIEKANNEISFAYKVKRGHGITKQYDGIIYKNTLASYAHIHSLASPSWANAFVDFIIKTNFTLR